MAAVLRSFKYYGTGNGQQGYLSAVMPEKSRKVYAAEVGLVDNENANADLSDDQEAICMAVIKSAKGTTCLLYTSDAADE